MNPMRQRLLLAAGWLVAVVGAGIVASGAVAVAGGQVFDRPLRPLTAAEVEALPVAEATVILEPDGPLASGGSESISEDAAVESDGERTVPAEPAGPGGASADHPVTPGTDLVPVEPSGNPLDVLPASGSWSEVSVTSLAGGSASIAVAGDGLQVLWATPRPGYAMGLRFNGPTDLILTFTSSQSRSTIAAALHDGDLLIDTSESRR